MSRISGESPQFQQLQTTIKNSLADRNLDQNELKEIKAQLQNTPGLSDETKAGVIKFLDQAHQDSKGFFFGLFGKGISEHEMSSLKSLADSLGNNPILKGLVQELEQQYPSHSDLSYVRPSTSASSVSNLSQNFVQQYNQPSFNTVRQNFPAPASQPGPAPFAQEPFSLQPSPSRSFFGGDNDGISNAFSDFYVTQNRNGLPSGSGDCGPACAAMVAKRFGFLDDVSNRDAVVTARHASGVTQPRNGAWAISEAEVVKSVENMTGGQVHLKGHETFSAGQTSQVISSLRAHIDKGDMPVLETGSPYNNSGGRHYMIVMEVKPNGNLVLADPGGRGQWEMTPQKLAEEMKQADGKGGSHILAFNK